MTARARSGFTLIEVMAAVGLLGVFTAVAISLSTHLFSSYRMVEGYSDDLLGCQRTLRAFRADIVAARDVVPETTGAKILAADGDVIYRLSDGRLTRTAGGVEQLLTRHLQQFEVRTDDGLVRLRLELGPRARAEHRRRATLATAVRLRGPKP